MFLCTDVVPSLGLSRLKVRLPHSLDPRPRVQPHPLEPGADRGAEVPELGLSPAYMTSPQTRDALGGGALGGSRFPSRPPILTWGNFSFGGKDHHLGGFPTTGHPIFTGPFDQPPLASSHTHTNKHIKTHRHGQRHRHRQRQSKGKGLGLS